MEAQPTCGGTGVDVSDLDMTTEQWRAELDRLGALPRDNGGKTTRELAESFGIPERTMSAKIRTMLDRGLARKGTGYRRDTRGAMQQVPVYFLTTRSK